MAIHLDDLGAEARKRVLAEFGGKSRSKYGAVKESRGDISFDSRKEAARYDELMLRLKAGQIRDLRLQVQFTLKESYVAPNGERIRAIRYVADFAYYANIKNEWVYVVEDVKSKATKTAVYRMKKKMMHEKYGISIEEV